MRQNKAIELMHNYGACYEAQRWGFDRTVQEAWEACDRGDWMLWMYGRLNNASTKEVYLVKGLMADIVSDTLNTESQKDVIRSAIAYGRGDMTREEFDAYTRYIRYDISIGNGVSLVSCVLRPYRPEHVPIIASKMYGNESKAKERKYLKISANICRDHLSIEEHY